MKSAFLRTIRTATPATLIALLLLACLATPQSLIARDALPFVRIVSPAPEVIYPGPDISVQIEAGGLQIAPGCNSVHIALDNEPFAIKYDVGRAHVLRNVMPGTHTVRVWLANHLNQAIDGTLQYVTFSIGYPNEENRPARGEPFLTLNLPQGRYLGIDGADVTLDFMVTGVPLSRNGYRVQYYVDGRRYIAYDCNVRQLRGLEPGLHRIRVELVDEANRLVPGPFASNERVIQIAPDESPRRRARGERPPKQPVLQSIPGAMTAGQQTISLDELEADRQARETRRIRPSATQRDATDFKLRDDVVQPQKIDFVERKDEPATEDTTTTTPRRRIRSNDDATTTPEMRTIRVTPAPPPASETAPPDASAGTGASVPMNLLTTREAAPAAPAATPQVVTTPTPQPTPAPAATPGVLNSGKVESDSSR